ncbi:MAG: hypothetical protein ABFS17_04825 [Chloroflexota bacterium]
MKVPKVLSELLFAIFILLFGINYFVALPFATFIFGILAIAIGVLKFLGK